jgi:hypothetical protein
MPFYPKHILGRRAAFLLSRRGISGKQGEDLPNVIDCRCEDGHFPVSTIYVTISNHHSLSSSETEVYIGVKKPINHLSDWARCQKAVGGIYFTNKWRAETLQPGLDFDIFKPRLKSGIVRSISWLNSAPFWDDLRPTVKASNFGPLGNFGTF